MFLREVNRMDNQKSMIYAELVAFVCMALLGIEIVGFTLWYFIQRPVNPFQMFEDAPVFTMSFIILFAVCMFLLWRLIRWDLTKKAVKYGNSLPQASSFIEFLKVSRMWVLVLVVMIVIPLLLMKTLSSALKIAPEGIAKTVFDVAMVFFIAFGFMLAIVGLGKMISTSTKLLLLKR